MSYADSLRQQAEWIREALDPNTPEADRISLADVDLDELEAAADEIERLEEKARKRRCKHVHTHEISFDSLALAIIAVIFTAVVWGAK